MKKYKKSAKRTIRNKPQKHLNNYKNTPTKIGHTNYTKKSNTETLIKNSHRETITDPAGVHEVWRRFCAKIFNEEPPILNPEAKKAITSLRNNKAARGDAWNNKSHGKTRHHHYSEIMRIFMADRWVANRMGRINNFFAHKNGSSGECNNYETISLMTHISKILLYIITNRLKAFLLQKSPMSKQGWCRARKLENKF